MMAEKNLQKEGMIFKMMPTPTSITQSCGLCVRIEDKDSVNRIINEKITNYKNIYLKSECGYKEIN
ncbi:Putative uncharacterized protein [Clostridium chauvoei JF4335]|nr:Putative uncharacterized protein [Clostridium chauvoei JF4335]